MKANFGKLVDAVMFGVVLMAAVSLSSCRQGNETDFIKDNFDENSSAFSDQDNGGSYEGVVEMNGKQVVATMEITGNTLFVTTDAGSYFANLTKVNSSTLKGEFTYTFNGIKNFTLRKLDKSTYEMQYESYDGQQKYITFNKKGNTRASMF